MTPFTDTPHRLFDRRWRSGHPFCPRLGRMRRVVMTVLLLTFALIIGAYNYLTDATRVRTMAEAYLSQVIGGKVEVRNARLSIFDGLRVDGVNVYVDVQGNVAPDSLIFSAQSFALKYDPRTLLAGQIEASQIIAQKPRVFLTENIDNPGEWNFHRLALSRAKNRRPSVDTGEPGAIPLPEVLLRNARVDINEFHDGVQRNVGYMAIDGQLTPTGEGNRYRFDMQGRGVDGAGPYAHGEIALNTLAAWAELHDFDFGRDVRSMLPAVVREFCERHGLDGLVDIPNMSWTPPRPGSKAAFRIEVVLRGVTLQVPPEDWISASEGKKRRELRATHPETPADIPITLEQGAGRFIFTEAGILVQDVAGKVEDNLFTVNGHIDGYGPDAPAALTIRSADEKDIFIPANPHWASSLPPVVRNIYQDISPTGTCKLTLHVDRTTPGAAPVVSGQVDIVNAQFKYRHFAYPVREASGSIAFGPDPARGGDFVKIINFRGRGMEGGPNADVFVIANGEIGPLGPGIPDPKVHVVVKADGMSSEPALAAAFPWEVSNALAVFDAEKKGVYPQYRGNFVLNLNHIPGGRWTFDTDLDLLDSSGRLVGFPYPLDHVSGQIQVRDGYVDILHASMKRNGASLDLSGRVVWAQGTAHVEKWEAMPMLSLAARSAAAEAPVKVDMQVRAHGVPIDTDLLRAIPADQRYWIQKLGISGVLDADGRVTLGIPQSRSLVGPAIAFQPQFVPRAFNARPEDVDFDLQIGLRNGTFWPSDGTFSVSDVAGQMRLQRDGLEIASLAGHRGKAEISADGAFRWADGQPDVTVHAVGKDVALDSALYAMLPEDGRRSWDEVQPQGTMDVELRWGKDDRAANAKEQQDAALKNDIIASSSSGRTEGPPLLSQSEPRDPKPQTDDSIAPPIASATTSGGFHAILKPREMSCTVRSLPWRLDGITGTIAIDSGHVTLTDIAAHHGLATLTASGYGNLNAPRPLWDLRLSAQNVVLDDEFRKASPGAMQSLIDSLKLRGSMDFQFSKLTYRGEAPTATTRPQAPMAANLVNVVAGEVAGTRSSLPGAGPDIDLAAIVVLHEGSMDGGVAMHDISGRLGMDAQVRDGKLFKLDSTLDVAQFTMAAREVTDFHATLTKPKGTAELNLDKVQANIAEGKLAGQLHMVIPEEGSSRYTLNLVLRDADVRSLVGPNEKDLSGNLSASISLEGAWGEANIRRGRGDVNVSGRELYKMPLILGVFQVTNLALPIGSPFNQGLARYSVDGQRINFERIDLKSDNMLMTGGGHLDFGTKQVRMTFTTDNPAGFKIPFINDIWQGARQELFKINIKGTIQQPRFEANSFGTVTTTIDEVLKGDPKKEK